jgi:hypothetical protein
MSLPLLQLPVEILQQITTHLSTLSKYALALALVGRPRPGDGVSEQHVRALQRLLLPTKLTLLMEVEKISPRELPERELGAVCAISPMPHFGVERRQLGMHAPWAPPTCHRQHSAVNAGVRLHTQHLHIDCQLCELMGEFEGEEVDANPARLDAAYMVERLATVMCLSWPAVVEVRLGQQQGTLTRTAGAARALHLHRDMLAAAKPVRRVCTHIVAARLACMPGRLAAQATVEVSGEMPGAPLSLVMSRLPALQRLTVEAWGAGPGLADACTIVGSLGTGALESLTISNGTSTNKTDLSSALVPLTSLTGALRRGWHRKSLCLKPLHSALWPLCTFWAAAVRRHAAGACG